MIHLSKRYVLALSLLGSVAACTGDPPQEAASTGASSFATSPLVWGTALGWIDRDAWGGPMNIARHADRIACDIRSVGLTWVRVDVGAHDGDADMNAVRDFIGQMHDRGGKVLVLMNGESFLPGNVDPLDPGDATRAWADAYVARMNRYIDSELTGRSRADAYEIGNEWNSTLPVSPSADAYLLDRVWREVKGPRGSSAPLIVSGGTLEARIDASYDGNGDAARWWSSFFSSLRQLHDAGRARPWDAFGVHPYNGREYRTLADNLVTWTRADEAWKNSVLKDLGDLQSNLSAIYGGSSPLWATEVGWSSSTTHPTCPGDPPPDGWAAAANNPDEQANTFGLADQVLGGNVDVAFWYTYRDDERVCPGGQNFVSGMRQNSATGYARKPLYMQIASRFGKSGDGACYDAPAAPGFCPGGTVPRDDMAAFLERLDRPAGYQPPSYPLRFGDVEPNDWHAPFVAALDHDGITHGTGQIDAYGRPLYAPHDSVPREQMAAFFVRMRYGGSFPQTATRFSDVPSSNVFSGDIEVLAGMGITRGCGVDENNRLKFCPSQMIRRDEMAAFLTRYERGVSMPKTITRFSDVDANSDFTGDIEHMVDAGVMTPCR